MKQAGHPCLHFHSPSESPANRRRNAHCTSSRMPVWLRKWTILARWTHRQPQQRELLLGHLEYSILIIVRRVPIRPANEAWHAVRSSCMSRPHRCQCQYERLRDKFKGSPSEGGWSSRLPGRENKEAIAQIGHSID